MKSKSKSMKKKTMKIGPKIYDFGSPRVVKIYVEAQDRPGSIWDQLFVKFWLLKWCSWGSSWSHVRGFLVFQNAMLKNDHFESEI